MSTQPAIANAAALESVRSGCAVACRASVSGRPFGAMPVKLAWTVKC